MSDAAYEQRERALALEARLMMLVIDRAPTTGGFGEPPEPVMVEVIEAARVIAYWLVEEKQIDTPTWNRGPAVTEEKKP